VERLSAGKRVKFLRYSETRGNYDQAVAPSPDPHGQVIPSNY
jgi:hypothetical protein